MNTNTNSVAQAKHINVTDQTFAAEVLKSDKPVLVDFWAAWCGPCQMIAPIVEELAGEFAGRATVAKVDVDANPELTARYGVNSIPALVFFKNGEVVDRVVGAVSKKVLAGKLNAQVN